LIYLLCLGSSDSATIKPSGHYEFTTCLIQWYDDYFMEKLLLVWLAYSLYIIQVAT